ncbi:Uncharacterised protein [Burkholderia pseudomallei]|nr:Uncharacterised protein [Burkholderia pseudomallei]CAJ6710522.1 Uncharacterised protein [Burkholderia pseudomallei]
MMKKFRISRMQVCILGLSVFATAFASALSIVMHEVAATPLVVALASAACAIVSIVFDAKSAGGNQESGK